MKVISCSLCHRCGGLSRPALCYSWSATSEAGPMTGAAWSWLRSSRQRQCQSGREARARLQRCGWPSGQLSQQQYCSVPQGGLYSAFWWSYLVSPSCCLLVIQLESHTSKPVTVPSLSLISLALSHTVSTRTIQTSSQTYKHPANPSWSPSLDEHQLSNATPYFVQSFFGTAVNASV